MARINIKPRKVYIAGPMTGLYKNNHVSFKIAEEHLTSQRFEVKNPAIMPPHWSDYGDYMAIALAMLRTCDYIYMLPGWTLSKGANIELRTSKAFSIKRIYLANEAMQDTLQVAYEYAKKNGESE